MATPLRFTPVAVRNAQRNWDQVKGDPTHPDYCTALREIMQALKVEQVALQIETRRVSGVYQEMRNAGNHLRELGSLNDQHCRGPRAPVGLPDLRASRNVAPMPSAAAFAEHSPLSTVVLSEDGSVDWRALERLNRLRQAEAENAAAEAAAQHRGKKSGKGAKPGPSTINRPAKMEEEPIDLSRLALDLPRDVPDLDASVVLIPKATTSIWDDVGTAVNNAMAVAEDNVARAAVIGGTVVLLAWVVGNDVFTLTGNPAAFNDDYQIPILWDRITRAF